MGVEVWPMVLLCCVSVGYATALKEPKYQFVQKWNLWKNTHGKSYQSDKEDLERHIVWLSNKEYIDQHNKNADIFGFTLAMNHLGDMTDLEYLERYSTYKNSPTKNLTRSTKVFVANLDTSYPDTVDWRTKGAVTKVKNQGDCGSSYAFSAIGSLEGVSSLARGNLISLSEQNIIDCSVSFSNHGCQGGNMYNAYQYVLANEGVDTTTGYPYRGRQSSCYFDSDYIGAEISGNVQIKSGDESSLMAAVANAGPVAAGVDASSKAFRYYSSGVYNLPGCSSTYLTHALLITGYGTYNGREYWLLKNSWGTYWGMSGYIMMSRNKYNQCGIASDASYPTL